MAILRIARMGNPVLLQKAAFVEDPTAVEIQRLAADMRETLEDIGASGLAAPQVFASKRVVVYRIMAARLPQGSSVEPRDWTVMVNPVISPKGESKSSVWEACLSVPGMHGKVPRFKEVSITYQDLQGTTHTHDAQDCWAALLQHECDHLDGVLYPMRMTDLSLLSFNEEPGPLAREVESDPSGIGPYFVQLAQRWPGRGSGLYT